MKVKTRTEALATISSPPPKQEDAQTSTRQPVVVEKKSNNHLQIQNYNVYNPNNEAKPKENDWVFTTREIFHRPAQTGPVYVSTYSQCSLRSDKSTLCSKTNMRQHEPGSYMHRKEGCESLQAHKAGNSSEKEVCTKSVETDPIKLKKKNITRKIRRSTACQIPHSFKYLQVESNALLLATNVQKDLKKYKSIFPSKGKEKQENYKKHLDTKVFTKQSELGNLRLHCDFITKIPN